MVSLVKEQHPELADAAKTKIIREAMQVHREQSPAASPTGQFTNMAATIQ
jgi:hypothetical protein